MPALVDLPSMAVLQTVRTCTALRKLAVVARLLPSALATCDQHRISHSSIQQPRPMAGLHALGERLESGAAFQLARRGPRIAVRACVPGHDVFDVRLQRVAHRAVDLRERKARPWRRFVFATTTFEMCRNSRARFGFRQETQLKKEAKKSSSGPDSLINYAFMRSRS